MKFSADTLLTQKEILDIHMADVSYSPMFSTIGLTAEPDACGLSLQLHYNRANRTLWEPFLTLEEGMKQVPSTLDRLCFADGEKRAALAFWGRDRFVISAENTTSVRFFAGVGGGIDSLWEESADGSTVIVRGYSRNTDVRDPDATVPLRAGIRVIRGRLEAASGAYTVYAGDDGVICVAFALEALELDEERLLQTLQGAPVSAGEAAALTGAWLSQMLGGFSCEAGSEREAEILGHALKGLLFNATIAQGRLDGYVSAFPSRGTYPTHFLWDSCFQNLALEYLHPRLAKDSLLLYAETQRADGKFAQFLCSTWERPHETQPALIGWATMRIVRGMTDETRDTDFMHRMYAALEKNHCWWLGARMTRFGVISCPHGLETGQDDSPRFDDGAILAVDMNSYLLRQMYETAALAALLGKTEESGMWNARADLLAQNMIRVLYDPDTNMFFDADPVTGERRTLWSASGFLPLWAGVDIGTERIHAMIREHMLDETKFFGAVPFPCIAYDQPQYDPAGWWRGPTWMSLAWLMLETLQMFGYAEEHSRVCRIYRDMISADGNLRELFHSQTGEGLGAYDQGWTAAVFIRLCKLCAEQ